MTHLTFKAKTEKYPVIENLELKDLMLLIDLVKNRLAPIGLKISFRWREGGMNFYNLQYEELKLGFNSHRSYKVGLVTGFLDWELLKESLIFRLKMIGEENGFIDLGFLNN